MINSTFVSSVTEKVQAKLGDGYVIKVQCMIKNNAAKHQCMIIRAKGSGSGPSIDLDSYRVSAEEGRLTEEQAACQIVETYHRYELPKIFDSFRFLTREKILEHAVYRLVNREKNSQLLEKVPHADMLNLTLLCYCTIYDEIMGHGAVMISNSILDDFHISKEELFEYADRNTPKLFPPECISLMDLIQEMEKGSPLPENGDILQRDSGSSPEFDAQSEIQKILVLTNKQRIYGAYYMAVPQVIGLIAKVVEKNLYILPSSVHECLIIPDSSEENTSDLRDMVCQVNRTKVLPEEVLSDEIYYYDREQDMMKIAA